MSFFDVLILDGEVISLDHLNAFTFSVSSTAVGKSLRVGVRFSNHCFTRAYDAEVDGGEAISLRDAGGRQRTFCAIRYRLSLGLPTLISSFADSRVRVFQTAERRNWVYSMSIDSPQGPYHLFFELRRTPVINRQRWDLNMVVESAYPENPLLGPPAILGRVSFVLLCAKVYSGKPVSTRR
jgi:hypothetical protein